MTKTHNKSFLRWLAIFVILLFLGLVIYRVSAALYHNDRLQKEFSAAATPSPYQQGIPMGKMDLATYSSYFPNIFAMPDYQVTNYIKTPVKIRYYSEIPTDGAVPALEINEGATILAIPEKTRGSQYSEVGYGFTSYPTYDKGWRYVRPFRLADEENQPSYEQYYYVRIETLEAIIEEVIQVNQPLRAAIRQQGWSVHTGKHKTATYLDQILYQHGAYLSPDLFRKVIDRWNVMMFASVGVIVFFMTLSRGVWIPKIRV